MGQIDRQAPGAEQSLEDFRRIARLMDDGMKLPGIPFRFGIDGIFGLVPGIGDGLTALMGLYALGVAARIRLPWHKRLSILIAILIDLLIGIVPLIGDIFDFIFKAHRRNLKLMERHLAKTAEHQKQT